jgi:hypothetical protein
MARARRNVSDAQQEAELVSIARLGRLQPDFLSFSSAEQRSAILDLCRPSDVHADQLFIAYTATKSAIPHFQMLFVTMKLQVGKFEFFLW